MALACRLQFERVGRVRIGKRVKPLFIFITMTMLLPPAQGKGGQADGSDGVSIHNGFESAGFL
jgi:hypothetical protein